MSQHDAEILAPEPPARGSTHVASMAPQEQGEALPEEHRSGWMSFIKSIASFSGDLSKMTAPSFILSPVSLSDWGEHPATFNAIQDAATPEQRMVEVVRWFIATLRGQYTSRNTSMGHEKKPLNPVLGEVFYGKWSDKDGRGELTLTSEQVSHHPPITAYYLENKKAGISVEGHSGQKTSFNGRTISVVQVGHALMRLRRDGGEEKYLITLPTLHIDGLWYGSPYIELADQSFIHSSTGYLATINYSGRGYFSGKAHTFQATIASVTSPSTPLLEAGGDWSAASTVKKGSLLPAGAPFWDASASPREEIEVKPLEQMSEFESRRLWKIVADGIRNGHYDVASKEKSRIEHEQRERRKKHEEHGTTHQLQHFKLVEDDPEYAELAKSCKHVPAQQKSYRFVA